jgi:excisionase family DNA binding protein
MRDLMNTREVAEYLRIKERKVYDLVAKGQIPCSRVTGKWLFPKALIDLWVLQRADGGGIGAAALQPPAVAAGSHDPLLEWAIRESRCELATLFDGSLDGIRRFAERRAMLCGLHIYEPERDDYNTGFVRRTLGSLPHVVVEWARREQGLIVGAGNPKRIAGLADLGKKGVRIVDRQEEAGSRILFDHLLTAAGLAGAALAKIPELARSETDVATAVLAGRADAGFGIAAVAHQYRLGFVSLHRERYDLVIGRRDYFEPPVQRLLDFARQSRLAAQARELGGYDVAGLGRVVLNGP